MDDRTATIENLKKSVRAFVEERDWAQFHSPKNMSMALSVEAAELMELFMWVESSDSAQELEKRREAVELEIADIVVCALSLCEFYDIDLAKTIERKLVLNKAKYPIEKSKGKAIKYTDL